MRERSQHRAEGGARGPSSRGALGRRAFLGAAAGGALGFTYLFRRTLFGEGARGLRPDPAGVLDLPEGFAYRVLQRTGEPMDDGYHVPGKPDGMACVPGPDGSGTWVLLRNHELTRYGAGPYASGQGPPPEAYERSEGSLGGVTRVVVDAAELAVRSSNLVLVGTSRNCAGGLAPGGWLSCEEDVRGAHGYVFLCDAGARSVQPPVRIPALGKMNHEAAVVDPSSGIVYLTEDRPDGCFYRFVPDAPKGELGPRTRGRLEALRIVGSPARDMNRGLEVGARLAVDWVALPEPLAKDDGLRLQGRRAGAAVFCRGEGIYLDGGEVVFTATTGGPNRGGQVWRLRPDEGRGGGSSASGGSDSRRSASGEDASEQIAPGGDASERSGPGDDASEWNASEDASGDGARQGVLELLAQADDRGRLDMPDNLCVAPWGDIVLAEDGADPRWPDNHLRILTPDGRIVDLARNARSATELAGVTFSPDGRVLFCNIQHEGLTVAITGPFRELSGT